MKTLLFAAICIGAGLAINAIMSKPPRQTKPAYQYYYDCRDVYDYLDHITTECR